MLAVPSHAGNKMGSRKGWPCWKEGDQREILTGSPGNERGKEEIEREEGKTIGKWSS